MLNKHSLGNAVGDLDDSILNKVLDKRYDYQMRSSKAKKRILLTAIIAAAVVILSSAAITAAVFHIRGTHTEPADLHIRGTHTEPADLSPTEAPEETVVQNGMTFELMDGGKSYRVTAIGSADDLKNVPETINGLPVSEISPGVVRNAVRDGLQVVYVPENIDNLTFVLSFLDTSCLDIVINEKNPYYYMDCGCVIDRRGNVLTKATKSFSSIPDYVESIGEAAFYGFKKMMFIVIPENVRSIGNSAFSGCGRLIEVCNLSSLDIKAGSHAHGDVGFYAQTVCLNENERSLFAADDFIFYKRGENVLLVDYTGDRKELVLPADFDGKSYGINQEAFSDYTEIISVTIPEGVTQIGLGAFSNCESLEWISIPKSVTSIEPAFEHCYELHTVYYGGTLEDWLKLYFSETTSNPCCSEADLYLNGELLTKAVIPDGAVIGQNAFYGCKSLHEVDFGRLSGVGIRSFSKTGLYRITIPESMHSILPLAFESCYQLAEVCNRSKLSITAGSEQNGYVAFYAKRVYTEGESRVVTDSDGFVFLRGEGENCLIGYCGKKTDLTLPGSFDGAPYSVNDYAFSGSNKLIGVTVRGVLRIGNNAFFACKRLRKADVDVIDASIGEEAFAHCVSLCELKIRAGVRSIGKNAFNNCTSLTDVSIAEGLKTIGDQAFWKCESLETVMLPDSLEALGSEVFGMCERISFNRDGDLLYIGSANNPYRILYSSENKEIVSADVHKDTKIIAPAAFFSCEKLQSVSVPTGVIEIGHSAFSLCQELTEITLPDGLTAIRAETFYGCTSLVSVSLPAHLTVIEENAFNGCVKLGTLVFPDGVKHIEKETFANCGFESVTLPEGLETIGVMAFSGCDRLRGIVIPRSVTSIGEFAFQYCESLESIGIPEGVDEIPVMAFFNCSSLRSIVIPASVKRIHVSCVLLCGAFEEIRFRGGKALWDQIEFSDDDCASFTQARIVFDFKEE